MRWFFLSLLFVSPFAFATDEACEPLLDDPYLFMEEIEGVKALAFAKEQNAKTVARLESDPEFQPILDDVLKVRLSKERYGFANPQAMLFQFSEGYFYEVWRDEKHVQGTFRRISLADYMANASTWETVLDLDALSSAEGKKFSLKRTLLLPNSDRVLLALSDGGKDAAEVREFDLKTRQFIADGFNVPEAKTGIDPIDADTVLIASNFGRGTLTDSGYARTVRIWKRGQPLAKARRIFAAEKSDVAAWSSRIYDGEKARLLVGRSIGFDTFETFVWEGGKTRRLPIPQELLVTGIDKGWVLFRTKEPWTLKGKTYEPDSIFRMPITATREDEATHMWSPPAGQFFKAAFTSGGQTYVMVRENIRDRLLRLIPGNGGWTAHPMPLPADGVMEIWPADPEDATTFMMAAYEDSLTPPSLLRIHDEDGSGRVELIRRSPDRFDSSKYEATQHWATSKDGTKVPYTVVKLKTAKYDGKNPTILYGYGGFQSALTPDYMGMHGSVWLERGGVYVTANIRGGDEFGPAWHKAAQRENRQRAFDDFAAIAEDLIASGITSPAHLGIEGGSNGGLLTGAVMLQRPELFNAVVSSVPLLDMLRFHKLLAGASWMEEYGNPDVPEDREFLLKYSPYQNVRADRTYPEALFQTSTKDDRVHPAHARKMAARMIEQGHPVLYFEQMDGGHGGDAGIIESSRNWAQMYTYLWMKLKR